MERGHRDDGSRPERVPDHGVQQRRGPDPQQPGGDPPEHHRRRRHEEVRCPRHPHHGHDQGQSLPARHGHGDGCPQRLPVDDDGHRLRQSDGAGPGLSPDREPHDRRPRCARLARLDQHGHDPLLPRARDVRALPASASSVSAPCGGSTPHRDRTSRVGWRRGFRLGPRARGRRPRAGGDRPGRARLDPGARDDHRGDVHDSRAGDGRAPRRRPRHARRPAAPLRAPKPATGRRG